MDSQWEKGRARDFQDHPITSVDLEGGMEGEEGGHIVEFTRLVPMGPLIFHERWVVVEVLVAVDSAEVVEEVCL